MSRDRVFAGEIGKQFEFDETVAAVFDDMLNRSIPFYQEVLSLIADLISRREEEELRVLDLGSSTA